MTEKAQRIAIAEARGWKRCPWKGYDGVWMPKGYTYMESPYNLLKPENELPDYLHDLNAMHEAENILTDAQWLEYESYLASVGSGRTRAQMIIHANAAQKSQAFLRTLGKWDYSK